MVHDSVVVDGSDCADGPVFYYPDDTNVAFGDFAIISYSSSGGSCNFNEGVANRQWPAENIDIFDDNGEKTCIFWASPMQACKAF